MKKIKTIHGKTLLIDDEDYDTAIQYRWTLCPGKNLIRVCTSGKRNGVPGGTTYKEIILGLGSKRIMFKNGNPLDLRRKNLLIYSLSEYLIMFRKRKKTTELNIKISKTAQGQYVKTKKTRYLGSRYLPQFPHLWGSVIVHNRKNYYLGSFTKEEYAGLAYDKKALELYGPDAKVNFPHLTLEQITKKLEKIKEKDAVLFHDINTKCHQGLRLNIASKTSRYVGVCQRKDRTKCWRAYINYHRKQYFLGYFETEEEAALAYDKMAKKIYGKTTKLNFPGKEKV